MDSFATLPAVEDDLLQALLDACAAPITESTAEADDVPTDAERYGSGNMTWYCVVA